MGEQTYIKSYMACNGYGFMVYWILRQAHLKEVGLTQNWETMTIQNLTILELLKYILQKGPQGWDGYMKQQLIKSLVEYFVTLYMKACDNLVLEIKWQQSCLFL